MGRAFRGWVLLLALVACSERDPSRPPDPDPERTPPNVVLILVDDLRHDSLGFTGHPFFQSPAIDRLAAEGTAFEDAFVVTSLCTASRATMLTGTYAHEHGVRDIWTPLDPSAVTVAELLRDAGYQTAWVGKWHLNPTGVPDDDFDHWVSFEAHGAYRDPQINVDGAWTRTTGHMTDILTEHAIAFLRRPHDRPFFLTLSHPAVHLPYVAQDRFAGVHADAPVTLPPTWNDPRPGQPEFLACRAVTWSDEEMRDLIRDYFDLLAGVDESVGAVVDELESQGILNDTLVLLISDNGYHHGEHGLMDKRTAFEPSMRVPLIVRYPPTFPPGTRVRDNLALNLDVSSTILSAAGVEIPSTMRGIPLERLATGDAIREQFLYAYFLDPRAQQTPELRALRTLDTKLVVYPGSQERAELYDLRADPDERTNLAQASDHADVLADMQARLVAERAALGDHDVVSRTALADDEWVARVFVEVRDQTTGLPIEGATVTCNGSLELCPGNFETAANGRWYRCARTAAGALRFRVLSVDAPGYAPAGPLDPVVLDPDARDLPVTIRLTALSPARWDR